MSARLLVTVVVAVVFLDLALAPFARDIASRLCRLCGEVRECTVRPGSYTCRTCGTRHTPEVIL